MRQTQRSPERPRQIHSVPHLSEAPWAIALSALDKNLMPGHPLEGNPVDEGTTRRGTDTPVHRLEKGAAGGRSRELPLVQHATAAAVKKRRHDKARKLGDGSSGKITSLPWALIFSSAKKGYHSLLRRGVLSNRREIIHVGAQHYEAHSQNYSYLKKKSILNQCSWPLPASPLEGTPAAL